MAFVLCVVLIVGVSPGLWPVYAGLVAVWFIMQGLPQRLCGQLRHIGRAKSLNDIGVDIINWL